MAQPIRNKLKAFGYTGASPSPLSIPGSTTFTACFRRAKCVKCPPRPQRSKNYCPAGGTNKHHYICRLFSVWFPLFLFFSFSLLSFCSGSVGHLVNLQSACKACSVRGVCAMYRNIRAQMWNICMCALYTVLPIMYICICAYIYFIFYFLAFLHALGMCLCVWVCVCVSV